MSEEKKITKQIDKIVMGVILGGAIGSVLGLTLAPRKGKETREMIKQKGQQLLEKGVEFKDHFMAEHGEKIRTARFQFGRGIKNFLRWLFRLKARKD